MISAFGFLKPNQFKNSLRVGTHFRKQNLKETEII